MGALVTQVPRVDGRWTGRIVPVEVRDSRGDHTYTAAALELTGGTPFERTLGRPPPELGGGRLPLLVTDASSSHIIDPATLPVGQEVEVEGRMWMQSPGAPADAAGGRAVSRVAQRPGTSAIWEHVIELRSRPTVLKKNTPGSR